VNDALGGIFEGTNDKITLVTAPVT